MVFFIDGSWMFLIGGGKCFLIGRKGGFLQWWQCGVSSWVGEEHQFVGVTVRLHGWKYGILHGWKTGISLRRTGV